MLTNFREYAEHYSVLALIFTAALVGLILFKTDLMMEQVVIWCLAGMYVLWGIVHHLIRRDLTGFIVLEYLLIGSLAGFVVSFVIMQK